MIESDAAAQEGSLVWYYEPSQKPTAEVVTGPQVEPTTVVLLNGQSAENR